MSAYAIFDVEIHDPVKYQEYMAVGIYVLQAILVLVRRLTKIEMANPELKKA